MAMDKEREALVRVCQGMIDIVERVGCKDWRDQHGRRLKDTKEWVEFYVTVHRAAEQAALSAPQQEPVAHPDDAAIDKFAAAMKAKMAKKRAEGRSGWDDPEQCTIDYLTRLFHDHVCKGDPVDIGNFAMMLWHRISATSLPAQYRRIPAPQQEPVAYSRSSPAVDTSAPRTIIEAPLVGVQRTDGRASMQAELGAALGSALSHYKSGDMQACAASLVRIVDLFKGGE